MAVKIQALVRQCAKVCALVCVLSAGLQAQQVRRTLPSATTLLPTGTATLGSAAASAPLGHISIALTTDDARQSALAQYLTDLTRTGSDSYHHWLTPAEFATRFGATDAEVSQATAWLESQGVHITGTNAAHTLLQATSTVAIARNLFAADLRQAQVAGSLHVVTVGDLSLPETAPQVIGAVSGLDDLDSSPLATAEAKVDSNASAVLAVQSIQAGQQDWKLLLQQANAQGITVLSDTSADYAEVTVIASAQLSDALTASQTRPDWQVAPGLPGDGLRAVPDFIATTDFSTTVQQLVSRSGGRLGNINATLYQLSVLPKVFTEPEGVATGTWTALAGLGTVNTDELLKVWPLGVSTSSTTLITSPIPVTYGSTLTLTATVTGTGGTPTGAVTFISDKAGTLGNASLDTTGKAVYTISTLDAAYHTFTASYAGDSTYAASSGTSGNTVVPQGLIVTASQSGSAVIGSNATINVTVTTTSGTGHALGTVSAQAQGVSDTNTYTGTLTASSTNGQSTATISFPMRRDETSPFTIFVSCTPASSNYSCTSPASMTMTPSNGNVTSNTSITSSTFVPTHGQSFTLTATVTSGASTLTPTGTVTFSSSSTGTIGTATLDSSGKATYTTKQLAGGQYSFNATYAGDINFATSTTPAPATVSVQPESASVTAVLNGTAAYGSNATITVTVAGTSGVGNPTGTVTVQGQGTTDQKAYSAALTAAGSTTTRSTASVTYPVSEKNTFTVLVSCISGDSSFTCPNPYTLSITPGATKTASATVLTSSPNPPVTGSVTTFTATVASGSASVTTTPTGSVDFLDNGTIIGTGTLSGGKATFSTTLASGSVHVITASYSGDTVYNNSTSGSLSTSAGTTTSTITLSATPNPPVAGQSVTFTATVSSVTSSARGAQPQATVTPTGTVQFLDNGTAIGTGTLTNGVATYTTILAAGTAHSVSAVYSGNGTYASATSSAITVQATTGTTATTTALVASSYAVTGGTNITFTSTVKSSTTSTSTPTGTVTLTSSKDGVIGTGTIGTDGTVNISSATLTSGTHNITATYSGDTNFAASSSSAIVVTISPQTGTLTASISPTTGAYGYTATITATVAVTSGAANGTVQAVLDGTTYTGTVTTGTGTITVNVPKPGRYSIVVSCPATNSFTCSNTVTLSFTATKGSTTTTVTASTSSAMAGDSITLTAAIANQGNATGTYSFTGTVTFLDGTKTLATAPVASNGATATVSLTGSGTHAITAVYSGDTNWFGSTSASTAIVTTKVDSQLVLSASSTTVVNGTNVIFTATASGTNASSTLAPPTGTVTFYSTVGTTVVTLGTATLTANGTTQSIATISTTGLKAGTNSLYAIYAGDTNYKTSTSNTLTVTVGDFAVTFNPATLTVTQGKSGQAIATVTSTGGFSGTVTLGCTPPPGALMTCSFAPATLSGSGTSTLTVTTTVNTATAMNHGMPWRVPAGGSVLAAVLWFAMPGRRRRISLLLVMCAVLMTITASGCATVSSDGVDGGGSSNNGTPYGSQLLTITLSGTDGVSQTRHNSTYQVTVQ